MGYSKGKQFETTIVANGYYCRFFSYCDVSEILKERVFWFTQQRSCAGFMNKET